MSQAQNSSDTSAPAPPGPTDCGSVVNQVDLLGLRVGSLFIVMFTSMLGALFPVITRRTKIITVPPIAFEYVSFLGLRPAYIQHPLVAALQNTLGPVSLCVLDFPTLSRRQLLTLFLRLQQRSSIFCLRQPLSSLHHVSVGLGSYM